MKKSVTKVLLAAVFVIVIISGCVTVDLNLPAEPETVTFLMVNKSNRDLSYCIYWHDHPFRNQTTEPTNIACGGVDSGKKTIGNHDYPPGDYEARWTANNKLEKVDRQKIASGQCVFSFTNEDIFTYTYDSSVDPYDLLDWYPLSFEEAEFPEYGKVGLIMVSDGPDIYMLCIDLDDKTGMPIEPEFIIVYVHVTEKNAQLYQWDEAKKHYGLTRQAGGI